MDTTNGSPKETSNNQQKGDPKKDGVGDQKKTWPNANDHTGAMEKKPNA